jgi:signal transduction histidine kinase
MVASTSRQDVRIVPTVLPMIGPDGALPWSATATPGPALHEPSLELEWMGDAQQRERRRIARELHDVVGQVLTAMRVSLMVAQRTADPAVRDAQIAASLGLIETAQADVRAMAHDLRPSGLGDLGLAAAIRWYLARQEDASGVRMAFRSPTSLRLGSQVETAAYRIVQEAVTNVLRHASAHLVIVSLRLRRGDLHLDVEDDGVGFDLGEALATPRSLGLTGMFERAHLAGGRIELRSEPGRGTQLHARFPLRSDR